MIQKKKEKYYWKEYLDLLDKRLTIAKKLEKKEKNLAFLIPLIIIDGLASIKYPSLKVGKRFNKLLENYSTHVFFKEKVNREYLYFTYRCSLAHGTIIPNLFFKGWGKQNEPNKIFLINDNSKILSIPLDFLIKEVEEIIKNLKMSFRMEMIILILKFVFVLSVI